MSRIMNFALILIAALFTLNTGNLSAQKTEQIGKGHGTFDKAAALAELKLIRQRLQRLEKIIENSAIKSNPAATNTVQKKVTVDKHGLRVFHKAPIEPFKPGASIPMAHGHHEFFDIPAELAGRNFLQRGAYQGKTSFEILKSQTVFVAFYGADWGGGGNSSGNWQPEVVSKQELKKQGWKEIGELPVVHSIAKFANEKPWILFKRNCKVGEKFKLRNHKYQAPILFWGKARDKNAVPQTDVPQSGAGLVGEAKVGGKASGIMFHYTHGKVFNPKPLRSRIDGDFVLELSGKLVVPNDMMVNVWHAGGGVNGDVNTLFIGDRQISSVGDDRKKHFADVIKFKAGKHAIRWRLVGGTFRNNFLKFNNAKTGKMLSLEFKLDDSVSKSRKLKEFVRVGVDQRGWPIPSDW